MTDMRTLTSLAWAYLVCRNGSVEFLVVDPTEYLFKKAVLDRLGPLVSVFPCVPSVLLVGYRNAMRLTIHNTTAVEAAIVL